MPDKLIENSPAKINLFLKVINKRSDGYFNIRSGVTFVNLYDQVIAEQSKYFQIDYKGKFAPINGQFDNCIVEKLFNKMQITKPKYKFTIIKNIPTQSGLGSASSNVAAVVRILNKLKLIDYKSSNQYISIGSDVPLFINFHDCLIRGRGEKIINQIFPKYYFLIVKPNLSCSTKEMYLQISENKLDYNIDQDIDQINDFDEGNDFEKIIFSKKNEIYEIYNFLKNINESIFVRLTGSGSCIFATFDNIHSAKLGKKEFNSFFPNLWSVIAENNNIVY